MIPIQEKVSSSRLINNEKNIFEVENFNSKKKVNKNKKSINIHFNNMKLASNLYTSKIFNLENTSKNSKLFLKTNQQENKMTPKTKRFNLKINSMKKLENSNLNNFNKKTNNEIVFEEKHPEGEQKKKVRMDSFLVIKKETIKRSRNPLQTSIDLYYKKSNDSSFFNGNEEMNFANAKKTSDSNSLHSEINEKLTLMKNERGLVSKIKDLEKDNQRLRYELEEHLSFKKDTYREKYEVLKKKHQEVLEQKNELQQTVNKKLFQMYLQTEINNRKNMEAHTRELSYRYGSDNNESICLLKKYVKELKESIEMMQNDTDKFYKQKYEKIIEEKDQQIKILKDLFHS
jgi:hypothetical protein